MKWKWEGAAPVLQLASPTLSQPGHDNWLALPLLAREGPRFDKRRQARDVALVTGPGRWIWLQICSHQNTSCDNAGCNHGSVFKPKGNSVVKRLCLSFRKGRLRSLSHSGLWWRCRLCLDLTECRLNWRELMVGSVESNKESNKKRGLAFRVCVWCQTCDCKYHNSENKQFEVGENGYTMSFVGVEKPNLS